ncbi:MAG TPA: DUF1858 domain-containing protein [Candidatus Butyricicoccus avistercoris]|uniref:DUF1858 domain-containing protein n=1 Tax=Candidatus Butyricicoccus avistercoris TaxID=2838518 RepID=A0A9D1PHW3_9FIRM|nr:DUF1858 domain-containing protein [Candidatus Butyricicoccus avistercoris]
MATVTKTTKIGEVLAMDMGTSKFFFEMGMHCLGCPASQGESIEEACMVHGVDVDELVTKLNAFLAGQQ